MVEVVILCVGAAKVGCIGVVDIMVLGGDFLGEVVEGVELVVGYVVMLVLWYAMGEDIFCVALI